MAETALNKNIKELVAQKKLGSLISEISIAKECLSLMTQIRSLEKSYGNELLRDKDNPEKWLELYKGRLSLEEKLATFNEKVPSSSNEQELYDAVLDHVVRTVLHEQLELDTEESNTSALIDALENSQPPADYYEAELERNEEFQNALDKCSSKDIEKARNRLIYPLTHNNMSYTLKRSNYTTEDVKVQTVGFLGRTLFPVLSSSEKYTKAKTPVAKGLGDWVDTPTSFVLARTNDLLQEIKGQLALCADNKRHEEEAADRRHRLMSKILRFLHFPLS